MNKFGILEEKQRELFLNSHNKIDEKLFCEIPVFCRSVDVVLYDKKNNTITAIEFKLNDWKRAVRQALSVAICFDYIEICVPLPKTEKGEKNILNEFKKHGKFKKLRLLNIWEGLRYERAIKDTKI